MNVKKRKASHRDDNEAEPLVIGTGKEKIAIIPGFGIVRDIFVSDDMNDCVDALFKKNEKEVFAYVEPTERSSIRKRDLKGKSAEIKAALMKEFLSRHSWTQD